MANHVSFINPVLENWLKVKKVEDAYSSLSK